MPTHSESRFDNMKIKMFNTAIKLLLNHQKEELQINHFCLESGISRTTFYYHYESFEELFSDMKTYYNDNLMKLSYDAIASGKDKKTRLKNQLLFFKNNADYYTILPKIATKTELSHFHEDLKGQIQKNIRIDHTINNTEYISQFYTAGFFGILNEWIKTGFKENPDEIIDIINSCFNEHISWQI